MFTGIITDIGELVARTEGRFAVRCSYKAETIAIGASIACDGACLTATEIGEFSTTQLRSMSASQLEDLAATQIQALSTTQIASLAPCCADPPPVIHYAPAEILSTIDQSAKARMESGAGVRGRTALPLNQKRSNNWGISKQESSDWQKLDHDRVAR